MDQKLPSYEQIVTLHRRHAPSDAGFDLIFTHCQIVSELAEQLIQTSNLRIDVELVRVGSLLHDIGAYSFCSEDGELGLKDYIKHGILGDDILRQEGFSEQVYRIASHHTGVGISTQDIQKGNMPLPVKDYFAESIEERLIMYADKFHTKSTPPKLMTSNAYREFVSKYGPDKVARFNQLEQEFGIPDLAPLVKKYNLEII